MSFILLYWRWIALAAAVAALAAFVGWFSHARFSAGRTQGRAEVTKEWDADRAAQRAAYDQRVAETQAKIEHDRQAAAEVEHGLREALAASDAGGRSLSQRVRDFQAALARCRTVPATPGNAGDATGTVGSVSGDAEFERLSDAAWAACARDGVRLNRIDAWRVKVTP